MLGARATGGDLRLSTLGAISEYSRASWILLRQRTAGRRLVFRLRGGPRARGWRVRRVERALRSLRWHPAPLRCLLRQGAEAKWVPTLGGTDGPPARRGIVCRTWPAVHHDVSRLAREIGVG